MKLLKILAGIVASLVALVAIAIVALALLVDPNDYKPLLEKVAADNKIELHLNGKLGWTFYPRLGLRAEQFSVKPHGASQAFNVDNISIAVKILPLLHQQIIVEALRAEIAEAQMLHHVVIDTQLNFDPAAQRLEARNIKVSFDQTHLSGSLSAQLGDTPFVTAQLEGDTLDLDQYLAPPAKAPKPHTSSSDTTHNTTRDTTKADGDKQVLIPVSTVQALPGNFHITFQHLLFNHLQFDALSLNMSISRDAVLELKPLTANVYGGTLNLEAKLDARKTEPQLQLHVAQQAMQLEPALKNYLQTESPVIGELSYDTALTTRGVTRGELMQNLNGTLSFASPQLTFSKLDLNEVLDPTILKMLNAKLPQLMADSKQTVMKQVTGKATIQQGVVHNSALDATSLCTQFHGMGTFNLASTALDYHLGVVFPAADKTASCQEINANLKDIAWPVHCAGTLTTEKSKLCALDREAAMREVKKVMQSERGKELEKKLDDKLQKKFGKDADAIKGALKGLFK